jgi:hypothetical protein
MGSPLSIISQSEVFAMDGSLMASIFLAGREWLIPAGCAFGVFLVLVGWSYRTTETRRGLKLWCALLKIAGAALLLACLLEPIWSGERAKPGANLFAVVADNSRSMGVRDSGATETRGAALVRALADTDSRWRNKLAEDFEVRNYLADSRLLPTQDFHELAFDGEATLTAKTFHTLTDRHRGQPLAGLMFLTDGVVPDLDPATLAGLPPVYPVIFASDTPERDIALGTPTVTQTSFEDAPVTIQVEVTATGFPGQELVARLEPVRDTANADAPNVPPPVEQGVTVPRESNKAVVRMQVRPVGAGVSFYRLRVMPKEPGVAEALTENNETIVAVDRGSGQRRVLYVGAGRIGTTSSLVVRSWQMTKRSW